MFFTRLARWSASFLVLFVFAAIFSAPSRADEVVNISTTPGFELAGSPLSFSFDYDVTTNTIVGTPIIDFKGMVFTYATTSFTPNDFGFDSGVNQIVIGDIGTFPQPGVVGYFGLGTYPGVLVGYNGVFSGYDGSVIISSTPEPGTLALLSAGLLFLGVALSSKLAR
jgi:hypothetical protein